MKTGLLSPRVWLNPVSVWESLDQLDISQNQLARLAGISPGHLSLLMNGKRSPAPAVRRRLMRTLGVDDFHRLFIMERPGAGGGNAGQGISQNAKRAAHRGSRSRPPEPSTPKAKIPHT